MIRRIDEQAIDIYNEFTDSVFNVLVEWEKKDKELKDLKETERTRVHWAYKIFANFFNKRGGTAI